MRKILVAAVAAVCSVVGALQAHALPIAPTPAPPVTGIPTPCAAQHPFPEDASIAELKAGLEETYGFRLSGKHWSEEYRPSIKILWETLDAVSCTDYVETLQGKVGGKVGINATSTSGWSWGDWSLSKPGYVSLDLEKFKTALANDDEGRLVRLIVHEFAHVWNSDRHSSPAYWAEFLRLQRKEGRFSDYAGRSSSETFAEVVGYYVGRCALDNPYDTGEFDGYYEWVKANVFDGREFGPPPGERPDCTVPKPGAEEPLPGMQDTTPRWVRWLSGE